MTNTKAVILVGGDTRGTRFRPISLSVPKVLFPAGTKSLLAHAVDACIAAHVSEILLVGYYENSVFDQFIAEVNRDHPDVPIRYLREYKAMGTAGGLYHFRDQILRGNPDRFFLIHADVCCAYPLEELIKLQKSKNAVGVILGVRVPKQMSVNFGSIITAEASTGTPDNDPERVIHFVEKPEEPLSSLVNGGIYLFSVSVFDQIAKAKAAHEANNALLEDFDDDLLPIERDVLPQLADEGVLYVYPNTAFWRQVKEASSALVANRLELERSRNLNSKELTQGANIVEPVYVHPTAVIDPSAKIGPNVTIGANVRIASGVRVRDAVILDRVQIRSDAVIINSILCPGSRVGRWARIEGSPTALNEYESYVVKDGVKVPRVAIIAENVAIADEVHVQNSVVLPHKDIKADIKNEIVM